MNDVMLANPAVTRNLATLTSDGWLVIAPAEGFLAEGYAAKGRLPEPEAILSEAVIRLRAKTGQLHGKKVVITAGGTREALDPVRYLTNKSSGKMGYALAQAAAENGAKVTLITTTDRPTNYGVTKILVASTQDMYDAVMAAFPTADIFIGAAAVSDFKPATLAQDKIKKQGDGGVTLHLVQNPDILKTVGHQKAPHQLVVGFAAETKEVIAYGQDKLKKKQADMLIANDVSSPSIGFSSDDNVITILTSDQPAETLPQADKLTLAREIMQRISTLKSWCFCVRIWCYTSIIGGKCDRDVATKHVPTIVMLVSLWATSRRHMLINMADEEENKASKYHIGDILLAPAYGNLEKPFTGQVEKVYENSLLVEITENDPADQPTVNEMNHRAVVRMDEIEVIKHAPVPKTPEADIEE